jgi:hypothetical protein
MKSIEMLFLTLMLITVIVLMTSGCTMLEKMQTQYQEMSTNNL